MKKKNYKRKRGPVRSKKVSYDGINFASGLERYMYMALKKAKIKAKYEGETFVLLAGFHFENEVYERCTNGKGDYKNRGCKRILPIKYTPDFIGEDFIIETKGRANESFPMRRNNKINPKLAKVTARNNYRDRQIDKWWKWSWEQRNKIKYKELVEYQNQYKLKVYG